MQFVYSISLLFLVTLLFGQMIFFVPLGEATLAFPFKSMLEEARTQEADNLIKMAGELARQQRHAIKSYDDLNAHTDSANNDNHDDDDDDGDESSPQYTDVPVKWLSNGAETKMPHSKGKPSGALSMPLRQMRPYNPLPSQLEQEPTERHCHIEITSKISGVCQRLKPIGSACVSGDYMDVFNLECL